MITTNNGIELRNLEEQVLKNQQDIARHYEIDRVIADLGIRVLGEVPSYNDLLLITGDSYGDAYKVVSEGDYYVWTRSNPVLGIENPYWFNIGPLSIPGPQGPIGPQGETGPQGERGSVWTTSAYPPVITADTKTGDQHLDTSSGMVYQYDGTSYQAIQSIRGPQGIQGIQGLQGNTGPQGPQGEKGDTGDVGGFININGILTSTSQLPSPAALNDLTRAYLIGTAAPYDLYIQVGSTSDTAQWQDMGPLNVATYVTVNGQYQNVWDADTKLDKVVNTDGQYKNSAYVATGTGEQITTPIRFDGSVGAIVSYVYPGAGVPENPAGTFAVTTPTQPGHAVNKNYVDTALENKVDKTNAAWKIYGTEDGGTPKTYTLTNTGVNGGIPQYSARITLQASGGPTENYDLTNKQYVDSNFLPLNKTDAWAVYTTGSPAGTQRMVKLDSNGSTANTIPQKTLNNTIKANGNPTEDNELTPKKYVDAAIKKLYKYVWYFDVPSLDPHVTPKIFFLSHQDNLTAPATASDAETLFDSVAVLPSMEEQNYYSVIADESALYIYDGVTPYISSWYMIFDTGTLQTIFFTKAEV